MEIGTIQSSHPYVNVNKSSIFTLQRKMYRKENTIKNNKNFKMKIDIGGSKNGFRQTKRLIWKSWIRMITFTKDEDYK